MPVPTMAAKSASLASISKLVGKKRSANWSDEEKQVLIEEVERNAAMILGPLNATVTAKARKHAWKYITFKASINTLYTIFSASNIFSMCQPILQ